MNRKVVHVDSDDIASQSKTGGGDGGDNNSSIHSMHSFHSGHGEDGHHSHSQSFIHISTSSHASSKERALCARMSLNSID